MMLVVEWLSTYGRSELAPEEFDQWRLGQTISRMVTAFDKDIRSNGTNEVAGSVFIKWDDVIDATQRRQHLDTIPSEVIGRPCPFVANAVAIDPHTRMAQLLAAFR